MFFVEIQRNSLKKGEHRRRAAPLETLGTSHPEAPGSALGERDIFSMLSYVLYESGFLIKGAFQLSLDEFSLFPFLQHFQKLEANSEAFLDSFTYRIYWK